MGRRWWQAMQAAVPQMTLGKWVHPCRWPPGGSNSPGVASLLQSSLSGEHTQFSFSTLSAFSCIKWTKYGPWSDIEKLFFSILSILYWVEIASQWPTEEFSKSLPWHLTKNLESGCMGNVSITQNKTKNPYASLRNSVQALHAGRGRSDCLENTKLPDWRLYCIEWLQNDWTSFKRKYTTLVLSPFTPGCSHFPACLDFFPS